MTRVAVPATAKRTIGNLEFPLPPSAFPLLP